MNRKLTELTENALDRMSVPHGKPQLIVWDDELPGFGVVVGKKTITFIANYWANGVKRRKVIGRRGAVRSDGNPWTVTLAVCVGERFSAQSQVAAIRARSCGTESLRQENDK